MDGLPAAEDHAVSVLMTQIVKQFGQVLANNKVDFTAKSGEIHALLGENGAGKSTMMCMLSGVYRPTRGEIRINGQLARIHSPKDAARLGIGMVFQNFRLVNTLTATENIILGVSRPVWRSRSYMRRTEQEITALANRFGLGFPANRAVWQLSVGEQQRVEIVKTLYRQASIIILDEPTSVLTPGEVEQLFETLRRMKAEGKTIIITTHKLKEVMAISDRISVMRKGHMIHTVETAKTSEKELAHLMVGKDLAERKERVSVVPGPVILEVLHLDVQAEAGRKSLDNLSFDIRGGEIVGIAGVAGNGQKELAEVLNGLRHWQRGSIIFKGKQIEGASVRGMIGLGVAHVPENRMKSGLAGSLNVTENLLFKAYDRPEHSRFGLLRIFRNKVWAQGLVDRFAVKTPAIDTPVRSLSGGNQQKLLFAREISLDPDLMVAVHPTQGLDVSATESVHELLTGLRNKGKSVLLISEDLDELLQLSDRILVLFGGRLAGEVPAIGADRGQIGLMMAGAHEGAPA